MAGNGISGIRDNDLYLGWIFSTNWGDYTQATKFWEVANGGQGFKFQARNTIEDSWEGDANIFENLSVKASQLLDISIPERMRPITMGCGIKSICGTSSETYTAATYSSTLANAIAVGDTTVKLTADAGNTGTVYLGVEPGYSSTNFEVIALDATTRTTPNYTYTIASGGAAKLAHTNGSTVMTSASHSFVPKATTYDPATIELGVGYTNQSSGVSRVYRARDCVAYRWQLQSGPGGRAAMITHDWYGAGVKYITSFATPTWEGGTRPGGSIAGSPMTHNQATWTLNSLTTGEATVVKQFQLSMSRNTAPDDYITEAVTPAYFLPGGQMTISGSFQIPLNGWREFDLSIFGKSAAVANDTDSYIVGTMPLSVVYSADGFNTFTVTLPNVKFAAPNPSYWAGQGKALHLPVSFKTLFRTGVDSSPVTLAITNGLVGAY